VIPPVNPIRTRLQREYEKVRNLVDESGGSLRLVRVTGSPPSRYVVEYHCPSLINPSGALRQTHQAEFVLGPDYPSVAPIVTMLTPVFNPHVFSSNVVCTGVIANNWIVSTTLETVILNIGALLQLDPRVLNARSPANTTANEWVRIHKRELPLGRVNFMPGPASPPKIEWL